MNIYYQIIDINKFSNEYIDFINFLLTNLEKNLLVKFSELSSIDIDNMKNIINSIISILNKELNNYGITVQNIEINSFILDIKAKEIFDKTQFSLLENQKNINILNNNIKF